jgi:hypothetical protein
MFKDRNIARGNPELSSKREEKSGTTAQDIEKPEQATE